MTAAAAKYMYVWWALVVGTIHPKRYKFATVVKIKATGE